jgi:hypothetical protein
MKPGKLYYRFVLCVSLPKVITGDIPKQLKFQTLFQNTYGEDLAEFYMQLENTEDNPHLQCAVKTIKRQRVSTLVNYFKKTEEFKNVYVAAAMNWTAAKDYATKKETRVRGPFTHRTPYDEKAEAKLASFVYIGWQQKIVDYWTEYSADARILTWIYEVDGNVGTYFFAVG